ncbi:MAG: hypothetical protein U9Q34_03815 [Elusimicrobiota bacterium]|nr:hypothetical protein [Elusimicrobiota bacterium]
MNRSEKNKKKALILFGLLFLVFGGGVSVFFMSSGIEDLKGFDKKSRFSYGFDFKKAVMPFFEALGFTDGEDVRAKSEISFVGDRDFDELKNDPASPRGKSFSAARVKNEDAKYRGPKGKLSAKNRGLKRGGKGRSKSSLGKSSFSKSSVGKDINISQTGFGAKAKSKSKKAYAAMRTTNRLLAQTHRTNSSMEARSKWDKSFLGGGSAKGRMSYKGKAATELDEMKASVLDLKDMEEGTLTTPDIGAPKKDAAATAKDPAIKKMADAANPMEGVVNSMFNATAKGAGNTIGEGEGVSQIPDDVAAYAATFAQTGEDASVTAYSCENSPTVCKGNTEGAYFKASYAGMEDGYPEEGLYFIQGENGEMVNVATFDADGNVIPWEDYGS